MIDTDNDGSVVPEVFEPSPAPEPTPTPEPEPIPEADVSTPESANGSDHPAGESDRGFRARARRRPKNRAAAAARFIFRLFRRLVAALLILAVGAAVYYYYRVYLPEHATPPEYLLSEAVRKDVWSAVTATGKIAALDEVSLYVKTTQKVSAVHVKEGDSVYAGQPLVTYDITAELRDLEQKRRIAEINRVNAELNAQNIALPATGNELLQYTADVSAARKNITDSENAIESYKIRLTQQRIRVDDARRLADKNAELKEQGFLTNDEYDQSVSAYRSAEESLNDLTLSLIGEEQNLAHRETQLRDAEQKLVNVKNRLGDEASRLKYEQQLNIAELARIEIEQIEDGIDDLISETLSPVNGSVVAVMAAEGGTVTRGNPVARIEDLSAVIVEADIAQYDAPQVELGQRVNIYFEGLSDNVYAGSVQKISAGSVEKENGSEKEVVVPVEIAVDDMDERLRTGFDVDVDVVTSELTDVLSVPSQAVFNEGGERYVYTLEAPSAMPADASEPESARVPTLDLVGSVNLGNIGDTARELLNRGLAALDGLFPHTVSDAPVPVRRRVEVGLVGDNGAQILGGLAEGDTVVLNP